MLINIIDIISETAAKTKKMIESAREKRMHAVLSLIQATEDEAREYLDLAKSATKGVINYVDAHTSVDALVIIKGGGHFEAGNDNLPDDFGMVSDGYLTVVNVRCSLIRPVDWRVSLVSDLGYSVFIRRRGAFLEVTPSETPSPYKFGLVKNQPPWSVKTPWRGQLVVSIS